MATVPLGENKGGVVIPGASDVVIPSANDVACTPAIHVIVSERWTDCYNYMAKCTK